jgi:hypothetical protein
MLKSAIFVAALVATIGSAASVQAQANPNAGDMGTARERLLEPMRPGAARMQQFESVRRLNAYSAAGRQRAIRQAQSLLAASHTSCDVVNAAQVGRTERRRDIVEVACSNGYGYILVDGTTPAAFDCLQIAEAAAALRRENPRADVGSQCSLNENGG